MDSFQLIELLIFTTVFERLFAQPPDLYVDILCQSWKYDARAPIFCHVVLGYVQYVHGTQMNETS